MEQRTREREAALAQVHEMQKMESLGQLTGGVAHDFNNLLMAVMANLELLKKRLPANAELARLIDGALAGAERGTTLTKRMLAFARRQELKPASVQLRTLIQGMEDMLKRSLGPGVNLKVQIDVDLPPVLIDPHQFELALLNLALNARDAMPDGGDLDIAAVRDKDAHPAGLSGGDYVTIVISDSGFGMDQETLKRATEPFFTTKGIGKGTGLGLSMVQGLMAQSGGTMDVRSEVASGTQVRLWLPVDHSSPAGKEESIALKPRPNSTRSLHVMVVDDDPLILSSTVIMLEDLGHVAIAAASGAAALEALRENSTVDVVVTDHAMPGMNGLQLANHIQQQWPWLAIILASGYADHVSIDYAPLERLAKPYSQAQIADCIDKVVRDKKIVSIQAARCA